MCSIQSVQFSRSVVSDSLWSHEPQHARPPCPSPTPRVHPNLCPLSWWCHPTISSSVVPFSSCPQSFPASGSSQMSQLFADHLLWSKYWSFSFIISPSNEQPGLTSFRMDCLDLLAKQSIGVSASSSVLPMNTQDWSPLGWPGYYKMPSKQRTMSLGLPSQQP